jgi:general secretion pathway protein I
MRSQRVIKKTGFTLIETIMAMVIMSTGILLLVNTWGGSFVRLERTQKAFEIASLLERKMIDYEIKYRGKNIESIPDSEDGTFDGFPDYAWSMTSKKLEFPDIGAALTSQQGGVDNMTEMVVKQLTDTLSKSIKEVTISITYSRPKKKPLSYSITTYFIDYDKGGSLGMPSGGGG